MKYSKVILKQNNNARCETLWLGTEDLLENRKQTQLAKARKAKEEKLKQIKQQNNQYSLAKKYFQLKGKVEKDPVKKYEFKQNPISISCDTQEEVEELMASQKYESGLKNRNLRNAKNWENPLKAAENLGIRMI